MVVNAARNDSVRPVQPIECAVCMDNDACMVLIPCGHVSLCTNCATPDQQERLQRLCPYCRRLFSGVFRVYGGRVVAE